MKPIPKTFSGYNSANTSQNIPTIIGLRQNIPTRKMAAHTPQNCIKIKLNNYQEELKTIPSFFLSNVCHITNKIDELAGVLTVNKNPSVAMITESWLSANVPDSAIMIGNNCYDLFRLDRKTPGGGVLAYVNSSIPVDCMSNLEEEGKEVLWLVLKPPRTPRPFSSIIVAVVYYPPGQVREREKEMIDYISNGIDDLLHDRPSSGIVIAGDFNNLNLSPLCSRFGLRKTVTAPTRGRNTLDQIITNMYDLFDSAYHLPPIGRSDHQCILLNPKVRQKIPPTSKKVRQMKPRNRIALSMKMAYEDWENVYSAQDVDEKVTVFNSIVMDMLNKTMPERTVRCHSSDKPWMTSHIKSQIKARQCAFNRGDKISYECLCRKVSSLVSKAKAIYYHNKAKDYRTTNPDKWFKSIVALAGANTTSTSPSSSLNYDMLDLAEKLQAAFTKPWRNSASENTPPLHVNDVNDLLKDTLPPLPSIGQVKMVLMHLKTKKAKGIDGIPAWVLKQYCEELAPVVHNIVVSSIIQCKYPTLYKHALITPIPKVRPPNDIDNDFRQISVLPQLAKVLEKIQLQLNIQDLKVKDNQHAFQQDRSTVSALVSISQKWFNATDNSKTGKSGIHAIFIDFRKAFDLIDHRILLHKLAAMNVTKSFWLWIHSFLSGRIQQVKVCGILSSIAPCPAGVPQGSVISPALFNVHINDLEDAVPNHLNIDTCKYADDCTQDQVVSVGKTSHIQNAVDAVVNWAETNKMVINVKKTKDMWLCFSGSISEPPAIQIRDEIVERVNTFKLLGVWFQNNLKWNTHVDEIIRKANRLLYHLRECRKSNLPTEVGLTLYKSKVRPIVEYASPVWGGLPSCLENEIERIQSRSLRILGLEKNSLPELSSRRETATKREIERIVNDLSHPCRSLIPDAINNTYNLRESNANGRTYIFSGTERHKRSFLARACKFL